VSPTDQVLSTLNKVVTIKVLLLVDILADSTVGRTYMQSVSAM